MKNKIYISCLAAGRLREQQRRHRIRRSQTLWHQQNAATTSSSNRNLAKTRFGHFHEGVGPANWLVKSNDISTTVACVEK